MIEINNNTSIEIDESLVMRVTEMFLRQYQKDGSSLSIAFVDDSEMRDLNFRCRGIDKETDILSFEGEDEDFGELIIDYKQIKRQAPEFSNTEQEELIFILVHGLLHLLGYEDESEEGRQKMEDLGYEFIKSNKLYD